MDEETYEKAKIAVDAVIFTIHDSRLKVLLRKREKEPYRGMFELYGGLVREDETAEDTLKRKLKDTLGHQDIFFQQFFTFTIPNRDPRDRTVSIGYITLISAEKLTRLEGWHDASKLQGLAFDHLEIIEKAKEYLKSNLGPKMVQQFMPPVFPLNKLQEAYEIIEGKRYDNRNFRKKMLYSEILKDTKKLERDVSHRPAKLFRFKS